MFASWFESYVPKIENKLLWIKNPFYEDFKNNVKLSTTK